MAVIRTSGPNEVPRWEWVPAWAIEGLDQRLWLVFGSLEDAAAELGFQAEDFINSDET